MTSVWLVIHAQLSICTTAPLGMNERLSKKLIRNRVKWASNNWRMRSNQRTHGWNIPMEAKKKRYCKGNAYWLVVTSTRIKDQHNCDDFALIMQTDKRGKHAPWESGWVPRDRIRRQNRQSLSADHRRLIEAIWFWSINELFVCSICIFATRDGSI